MMRTCPNRDPKVTYTVIEDLTEEIITLAEIKVFLQLVGIDDFDEVLDIIASAARAAAEKHTGLSIGHRIIQLKDDWQDENAYLPFAPVTATTPEGLQTVGYTAETIPGDLKLGILNMIYTAFNNRTTGLDFTTGLKLIDGNRRRVGL